MRADTDYRVIDFADDASVLFLAGNHRAFVVDHDLGERLRDGFDRLSGAERAEWERLVAGGLVGEENREVLRGSTFEDGADLAVNVNLTNICNLACTYCFADGGDYGRIKEAMGHTSVEDIFRFIEENLTPSRSVRLEMFGGEPLANFETMKEICDRSKVFGAEHGVRFVYRISTNLTLMPKGVLELFAEHRFIVSVSIDGGREVQDANRPALGGQGSYDRVMRAVEKVRAASDEITLVARMTVAQREPGLLENMLLLYDLNIFDYFQIYPGVFPVDEEAGEGGEVKPVEKKKVFIELTVKPGAEAEPVSQGSSSCATPHAEDGQKYVNFFLQEGMTEQFRDFLAAYPGLFRPDNRFKGVLEYERTVQMLTDGLTALSFCSGGRNYFTVSPDRSISPCHRLVGEPSFDVGTGSDITRTPDDWRLKVDTHPVCGQCWARYVCGGGCRQENYVASGDINVLNDESCRYQLLLAEEVIAMMARSSDDYRTRTRDRFADMFVSCGRPVMANGRPEPDPEARAVHFRPLTAERRDADHVDLKGLR
jgi:uncharacterized protein